MVSVKDLRRERLEFVAVVFRSLHLLQEGLLEFKRLLRVNKPHWRGQAILVRARDAQDLVHLQAGLILVLQKQIQRLLRSRLDLCGEQIDLARFDLTSEVRQLRMPEVVL